METPKISECVVVQMDNVRVRAKQLRDQEPMNSKSVEDNRMEFCRLADLVLENRSRGR